ncbi:MAG: tetratricopeptide repeat protein [Gemmatimonadota bacterium]
MFTTAQFRVFAGEPEERALSRPRHLLRDGDRTQAEAAYRAVIDAEPHLKAGWAEYFQLLRAEGRFDDALALAERATRYFEQDAFSGALTGAALVEMGRLREALRYLQASAEQDPDFGMVWHEMGYAAYRLGEHTHALLALDRAFALDPRSGTLHLRGKILRNAGHYLASEVAFTGAAEAAEFPEQRTEAERQIGTTRRHAHFRGKPADLLPEQRWFAEHGSVVLAAGAGDPVEDEALVMALAQMIEDAGWTFTVMTAGEDWPGWDGFAARLGIPRVATVHPAFGMTPLVVARRPRGAEAQWRHAVRAVDSTGAGLVLVIEQPEDQPPADVIGRLSGNHGKAIDLESALQMARHPEGRLAHRKLGATK